jgi:hypothetical protein
MQSKASTLPERRNLQEFTVPEDHGPPGVSPWKCYQLGSAAWFRRSRMDIWYPHLIER